MNYLEKRRQVYYAKLTIPEDVRGFFGGKLRFFKSTKTSDKREAQVRAMSMVASWKELIKQARGTSVAPSVIEMALQTHQQILRMREQEKDTDEEFTPSVALEMALGEAVEAMEKTYGREAAAIYYRVARGYDTPLEIHVEPWLNELRQREVRPKSIDIMNGDAKLLLKAFPTLKSVSTERVKKWANNLMQSKDDGGHGYSIGSVERIFSNIRNFWGYLQTNGIAPEDNQPFQLPEFIKKALRTQDKTKAKGKKGWLPFKPEEVVMLYESALSKRDSTLADLILLGMFTGARIEELCSLKVVDCNSSILSIKDSKTNAGIRDIPVHNRIAPTVQRLINNSSDGYLLSGLTFNKYGDRSNAIGKRFGRLKNSKGFGNQHVFHSIRKTVVTLLENAGVPENLAADIAGHEKPRITYGLYSGGSVVEVMRGALNRIDYPTLQLPRSS